MQRKKKKDKFYSPEDLAFAKSGLQPSTVGQIFNCLYTVVVNRNIKGFANYPTGVSVLVSINPSEEMVNGFEKVQVPLDWNPRLIDLRKTNF